LKNEELPFEEALSMATSAKRATVANTQRWIDHLSNRIAYERAMLDEQGGLVAEQHEIKVGGRVLVDGEWVVVLRVNRKDGKACSFRTARRYVPVVGAEEVRGYEPPSGEEAAKVEAAMKKGPLCNYPGERFATCTQAEWDAIYKDHRGVEVIAATDTTGTHRVRKAIGLKLHLPAPTGEELEPGYCNANRTRHYWPVFITDAKRKDPPTKEPETPASVDDLTPAMFNHSTHSKSCGNAPEPTRSSPDLFAPKMDFEEIAARTERLKASNAAREEREAAAAPFKALEEQLKCGVKVIAAPQLFPTPSELAARMVEEANIEPSQDVLEPSAGTGAICKAILASEPTAKVFAVEINGRLCELLSQTITPREDADQRICRNVLQGDFLEQNGNLGQFDRILMNPPFENGADIKHIQHAMHMLKPGGRLVAICANGPRQQAALKPLAENSGGWYEDLPAGTFASQGTNVSTALLLIEN
jgi:protein-L-isoaspartate O-methyltransferase